MLKRWSQPEQELFIKVYPVLGKNKCCKLFDRSEASIRQKAFKLGLTSSVTKLKKHKDYELDLDYSEYEVLEQYKGNNISILHKHKICGHEWKVIPNNLLRGTNCPVCSKKPYSKMAIEWLNNINANILHAENGGEQIIAGYKVDGYDSINNIVYEFHGDVFHGNLNRFKLQDKPHPYNNFTAQELYNATMQRMKKISKVAKIIYIWESEYKERKDATEFSS